jgi:hypothetical protein
MPRKPLWPALCHLSWLAAFLTALSSGLRIRVSHQLPTAFEYPLIQPLAVQGNVFSVHLLSGLVLTLALLGYVLAPNRQGRYAMHSLRRSAGTKAQARTLSVWLLGLLVLSGWLLHLASETPWFDLLRRVHLGALLLVLGATGWHAAQYLLSHDLPALGSLFLPSITRPQLARTVLGILLLAAVGVGGTGLNLSVSHPLVVTRVDHAPHIDGVPEPGIWQQTPVQRLTTHHGNPFGDELSQISIQALHDDARIYLLLRWTDSTPSLAHLPLRKTARGWALLHQGFDIDDERLYYEDKLALLLSNSSPLAALSSIHLGPEILAGVPGPRHGRGYHFNSDQTMLDLWQWKAVRTNSLFQADDHHLTSPYAWRACDARYQAGYHTDPKTDGGFSNNWTSWNATHALPLRVPTSSRFLVTEPVAFTPANAIMRIADSSPLQSATGTDTDIRPGTLMPSVLKQDSFSGDRGDVAAHGQWADGAWTLELSRPLVTDRPFDLPLQHGSYLWLAPFDHAQTRHGYHLRPLRLEFH